MNDDDRRLLQGWDDQLSPTLAENYELVTSLARVPVCVVCPMAQWYVLESPPSRAALNPGAEQAPPALECFCTAFRGVMYDGRRVVTSCDARADALRNDGETT